MHQSVDEPTKSALIAERDDLIKRYRNDVVWVCRVLEYKRRFEREEDFGDDGLRHHISILQKDSRRELRDISLSIQWKRGRIDAINNQLMDMAAGDSSGRK